MNPKIERFLNKHQIQIDDIKYIIREEGNTVIYTLDNRVVETYLPVKDFRDSLPVEKFLHPNKGIIAAASQIIDVADGQYLMADGKSFKYRVHNSQLHDTRLLMLGRQFQHHHDSPFTPDSTDPMAVFSVLDNMPFPANVIEVQMKETGFGAEFIFRYCNHAMMETEQKTKEEIVGHKFFDVIPSVEPTRLVAYMDVALNGGSRTISEYDSSKHAHITVTAYQPTPGFVVCMLMKVEPAE